jgi:hypothetical protein
MERPVSFPKLETNFIAANPCGGGQKFENDCLLPETEPLGYEAVCSPLDFDDLHKCAR